MEDMRDRKKIISAAGAVVLIVISVITVIPLLKLGVYDHPCADDFGYSIQTYQVWQETHSVGELIKTAWSTSIRFWHTWQGLYISAFVLALQPAIFGEAYYALTVWLTVGTIYGANLIFAEYVLHYKLKGSALGAMALAFTMSMVMVQWIPSAVQGLYWYNGAMNYTFFYGIFLLLIIGEISLHTAGSWWKYVLKVGARYSGMWFGVSAKKMADCNLQPAGSCWNIDRISDKCVLTWHRSAPSGFFSPARILGHNYKSSQTGDRIYE